MGEEKAALRGAKEVDVTRFGAGLDVGTTGSQE